MKHSTIIKFSSRVSKPGIEWRAGCERISSLLLAVTSDKRTSVIMVEAALRPRLSVTNETSAVLIGLTNHWRRPLLLDKEIGRFRRRVIALQPGSARSAMEFVVKTELWSTAPASVCHRLALGTTYTVSARGWCGNIHRR